MRVNPASMSTARGAGTKIVCGPCAIPARGNSPLMVRLNRIYTKTGDGGQTRLVGGQQVAKDSPRIETYGTVDELMACLGLVRTALETPPIPPGAPEMAALVAR